VSAAGARSVAVVDGPVSLALELSRAGQEVTAVVLAQPSADEQRAFRDGGVCVLVAPELDVRPTSRWLTDGYRLYRALLDSPSETLVFQGPGGAAYCSGRAKETGTAFEDSEIVVRFGEPTLRRALREGDPYLTHAALGAIVTERLALALADEIVAEPEIREWLAGQGWTIPGEARRERPDPTAEPLVSVVIPFYERTQFLAACLDSLARQTHAALEVVIADDGSESAAARDLLDDLERRSWPWPLRVVHLSHGGLAATRNRGWRAASADLVLFLDDDDLAFDELVASLVRARHRAGADVVVAGARTFEGEGAPEPRPGDRITISLCEPGELTLLGNHSGGPTCLWTRALLDRLGGFRSTPRVVEDWHLLVRAELAGARITTPPDPLWWYRRTPTSMFSSDPHAALDAALPAMAELIAPSLPERARLLPLLAAGAYRELERRDEAPRPRPAGLRALAGRLRARRYDRRS
jgi:hypothetical protein